jgi:hypothetical protein
MKNLAKSCLSTVTVVLLMAAPFSHAEVPASVNDARPGLLQALDGKWVMSGDVKGTPVTYTMVAAPALQGTFTEMRMKDVRIPAEYEAAVFIGYDGASQAILVHWMDNHGPRYSIPHGTGHIAGNTIQFIFPYKSGQFRNTMTYKPDTSTWRFVLEAAQPDGSWKHFARYEVKRH